MLVFLSLIQSYQLVNQNTEMIFFYVYIPAYIIGPRLSACLGFQENT